jgi:RND family efflux transporter MFP subunit
MAEQEQNRDHGEREQHDEPNQPSRRARVVLYVVGAVAAVVAFAFVLLLRHHQHGVDTSERERRLRDQAQGPETIVARARPAPPTRDVVLPGDVQPFRRATVYARASGYLDALLVDRGDRVASGQLLGVITTPETTRQLSPLVASLERKQALVDRMRPLVPAGVVAQADLDRAAADAEATRSDVDRLREIRKFDDIRAPFAGTVTTRYVDVGALMPAPSGATQSAQPLVDVTDLSRVRVVVYVGQRDAVMARSGGKATVVRDDDPLQPVDAVITRTADELDPRTRTMWVEIDLDNPRGLFKVGVYTTVTLHVPAPPGVMIPADAVALIAGKPTVAIVEDGRARYAPIEVADDDGKLVRAISGVQSGQVVASRITDEITDGAVVRAIDEAEAERRRQGEGSGSDGSDAGTGSGKDDGPGNGSNAARSTS